MAFSISIYPESERKIQSALEDVGSGVSRVVGVYRMELEGSGQSFS